MIYVDNMDIIDSVWLVHPDLQVLPVEILNEFSKAINEYLLL